MLFHPRIRVFLAIGVGCLVSVLSALACDDFGAPADPADGGDGGPRATDGSTDPLDTSIVSDGDSGDGGGSNARDFRYVFISSTTHSGKFADDAGSALTNADTHCKNAAQNSPDSRIHDLAWRAWLSTDAVSARSRVSINDTIEKEYRLLSGEVVLAKGFMFITGPIALKTQIKMDEKFGEPGNVAVWTGSYADGQSASNLTCSSWTESGVGIGFIGLALDLTQWSGGANDAAIDTSRQCPSMNAIYCFEAP